MENLVHECNGCYGEGAIELECCNGAGGCSCHGKPVAMTCRVCRGSGVMLDDADLDANQAFIRGACFLGSGPSSGYWADKGKRLNLGRISFSTNTKAVIA